MAAAFADVGVLQRQSLPPMRPQSREHTQRPQTEGMRSKESPAEPKGAQGSQATPRTSLYGQRRVSGTGPIAVPLAASLQGPRSERSSVVMSEQRRMNVTEGISNRRGSRGSNRLEEDLTEVPVLHLSVGVPAWGIRKNLQVTLTGESFRRVHQRLERFASEAAEREGAMTFNRPSQEERMELEMACAKEFDTLSRRFEAAKELQKSRKMHGAVAVHTVEEDAQFEMLKTHGGYSGGVEEGPLSAWTEDANEAAVNSAIQQLQNRAEQLKKQLAEAERSLELAEQRREAAENRLKHRMATGRKREGATQTDPEIVVQAPPSPVERGSPCFGDIGMILQPVSALRDTTFE